MTNGEEKDFFQTANAAEEPQQKSEELDMEQLGTMKLRSPKPLFKNPTKCKILDVKVSKVDATEKDSKQKDFVPFFMTLEFQELGGREIDFKETYRGGRLYTENGKTSTYVGPDSAMGRLKAACVNSNIEIGDTIQQWVAAMKGKFATLKAEQVMYGGKKYDKNYVYSLSIQ